MSNTSSSTDNKNVLQKKICFVFLLIQIPIKEGQSETRLFVPVPKKNLYQKIQIVSENSEIVSKNSKIQKKRKKMLNDQRQDRYGEVEGYYRQWGSVTFYCRNPFSRVGFRRETVDDGLK